MTFEFPMTESHAFSAVGTKRFRYTVGRLKKLATIAAKLEKLGWPVWVTMTGLAFIPPLNDPDPESPGWDRLCEVIQGVAEGYLADLGVYEEIVIHASKTVDQLPDAWFEWLSIPGDDSPPLESAA